MVEETIHERSDGESFDVDDDSDGTVAQLLLVLILSDISDRLK